MVTPEPNGILIERLFGDGRRAEAVELDGHFYARVYTATGRLYLEHEYADVGEATTTLTFWNGEGYPLSDRQRRDRLDAPIWRDVWGSD